MYLRGISYYWKLVPGCLVYSYMKIHIKWCFLFNFYFQGAEDSGYFVYAINYLSFFQLFSYFYK